MGGGSTSRTVTTYESSFCESSLLKSASYGGYSKQAQDNIGRSNGSKKTLPNRSITSDSPNPVVIGIDVTGSMGDAAFICWDKMPLLFGQLKMHYAEEPEVSFCAVGDAVSGDQWPLQICDFGEGDQLDSQLQLIYREGRGGGGITESYETAAYYYLNKCNIKDSKKAFLFLVGDEAPYTDISKEILNELFGEDNIQNVSTKFIFEKLQEKFEVVFIQIPYRGSTTTTQEVSNRWQQYLPETRVLRLKDAKGIVDTILGATAILNERRTLDSYLVDLQGENGIREEGQTPERIENVKSALTPLSTEFNAEGHKKKPSKKKTKGWAGKVKEAAGL